MDLLFVAAIRINALTQQHTFKIIENVISEANIRQIDAWDVLSLVFAWDYCGNKILIFIIKLRID